MLAVFVIWGLDTEGDAENPVLSLCWERFKRVGESLNLLIMKKLTFEKFANQKLQGGVKEIKGGVWTSTSTGGAHKGQRDAFYTTASGSPYVVYENGDSYWLGPGRVREV